MDDNDEEGAYDRDFYGNLPEGGEEPPLPPFRTFSFQAAPAVGPGSSTGQQPIQADGAPQDPEPELDYVNDDTGPVGGGDEDENGEEEPVTYEAQDRAVSQFMQQVIQGVQQQQPGHGQQHTAPVQLQQPPAQTQQLASTLPPGRQRLQAEKNNAKFDSQDERIDYWLQRGSGHLRGDPPREAGQQAMTVNGWRARYANMTAAQRLARDIPTPPGQPPVQQRTKRKYWSVEVGTGKKPKRKAQPKTRGQTKRRGKTQPQGGDEDDDYKSLDEGDNNYMSYIPEQAYLSENNLPYQMGIREIDPTLPAPIDPQDPGLLFENGRPVLGPTGEHLRDLPILPRRIRSSCPGWLLEVWSRYDKRINRQDISDRLPREKDRSLKPGTDYRASKGLFQASNNPRNNNKIEVVTRDFIISTKTDCEAADLFDPPAPSSETDGQRRERIESSRQHIFRNTVWEFHRDRNGVIRGIKQPGGVSDSYFPLPPIAEPEATRMRAASAKRNQFRIYSIAESNSKDWKAYAAKNPRQSWGHCRTGKGPVEDDTDNATETSAPAADPSTQGGGGGADGQGGGGGAAAPTGGGGASAQGGGGGANIQTTNLRRSKRNKQVETTAAASSTAPSTATGFNTDPSAFTSGSYSTDVPGAGTFPTARVLAPTTAATDDPDTGEDDFSMASFLAEQESRHRLEARGAAERLSRIRNNQTSGAMDEFLRLLNRNQSTNPSTRTGQRNNQAETTDNQMEDDFDSGINPPESTTEDQQQEAPEDFRIHFDFVEDEALHRLELQALAILRFRAVAGIPKWVQTQLDQLSQEQRNTNAREQGQENAFRPGQILNTVREAVRAGREAFRLNAFRNQNWRINHNNLHVFPESNNSVLVFRSAITLLTIIRHQTGDNIMPGFDENDEDALAIYAGENEQARKDRAKFARQVTREVNNVWLRYFPEDCGFGPESTGSPLSAANSATRSSAIRSQGQQKSPSPTKTPKARPRPETGPPSQPDDEDDDGDDDDDDEDEDDDYPDNGLTVTERLDREDAEKRQKQQHTQNTAPRNPAPTPNTTNNQPGPNQQHGQEDTTAKPSTGDTPPRRSSRHASAAATAAIQQQTSPTRPMRSSQQQRLSDSKIDPTLDGLDFRGPQPPPGGGAGGPMSPPQRPAAINTSPRTPNGRGQAPVNILHALSPRRSPRFQRTSQGSAQQQQQPGEGSPVFDWTDLLQNDVYSGDEFFTGPARNSPNTAGEFMDQLAQANRPTVYQSPPSARNIRNNPYFVSPQNRPHVQQQHHAPFTPYGHNDHDPLTYLYNQGQTLQHGQLLHQPQMPGARNSMDGIAQRIVTEVGGWNMNQRQLAQQQQQYQQYQQQQLAEQQQQQGQLQPPASPRNQLGIIGQYSNQIRQLNQQQGLVWPQQPPAAAHAPPFLPSVQQPTAQAPLGAPFEATAPTAQAPPAQAPQPDPEPESDSEPEPQVKRKPAAKKTGGSAKGKKRKASEDPTDEASTNQQPPTKTTKKAATTKATTKTTAAPRKRGRTQTPAAAAAPPGPSTRRQTRAQSAAIAEAAAAGDDGGADGGGGAGDDDKEADDAQATTTTRAPVKRKRGGGAAAKAPPGRVQKTRNAVKKGRVSGLHEVYDNPQKPDGGKESMQPGKKRKVMGAEKEEDDDMRDRDDDDDGGGSDYTED